jgi:hypothetical protein
MLARLASSDKICRVVLNLSFPPNTPSPTPCGRLPSNHKFDQMKQNDAMRLFNLFITST